MISRLKESVNANAALVRRGRWFNADILLEIGTRSHLVAIRNGEIASIDDVSLRLVPFDFALRGSEDAWSEFWKPVPKPMHHDVIALIRAGKMRLEGNVELAMAHFLTLKLMLEQPRKAGARS